MLVAAPGRGRRAARLLRRGARATGDRARRSCRSTSPSATSCRCSTSAPPRAAPTARPPGCARRPSATARSRSPSWPRRRPRSRAAGVERQRRSRRTCSRSSRRSPSCTRASRARCSCPAGARTREGEVYRDPALADALERLGGRGPGAVLHRRRGAAAVVEWVRRARRHAHARGPRAPTRRCRASRCASPTAGARCSPTRRPSAGGTLLAYALALLDRAERRRRRRRDRGGDGARAVRAHARVPRGPRRAGLPRVVHGLAGSARRRTSPCWTPTGWACAVTCTNGEGSGLVVPGHRHARQQHDGRAGPLAARLLHPPAGPAAAVDDGADGRARRRRPELVLGSAGSNRIRSRAAAGDRQRDRPRARRGRPRSRRRACTSRTGCVYAEPGDRHGGARGGRAHDRARSATRNLFFGGCQAVEREADGVLSGGGDPRRGGAVVAVMVTR